jgi:molybdopterin synthase sulfur carrier subunit
MKVNVRLFAGLKELVGGSEVSVDLADGGTLQDLELILARNYPRLEPLLPSLAFAVKEEYRSRDFVLHDRDEVAVIPPITGGGHV